MANIVVILQDQRCISLFEELVNGGNREALRPCIRALPDRGRVGGKESLGDRHDDTEARSKRAAMLQCLYVRGEKRIDLAGGVIIGSVCTTGCVVVSGCVSGRAWLQ